MRRLVILCGVALLAATLSLAGGGPAAARSTTGPGSPPRPAPPGTHWEHRFPGEGATPPEAGGPEVVGGTPALPGEFPYQVALVGSHVPGLNIRGQFCGGSLIAPDTVLTASHCVIADVWVLVDDQGNVLDIQVVKARPNQVDVLVGDVNLGTGSTAERLHVRQIRLDPHFAVDLDAAFNFFAPDVAVLQLGSPSTTGTPVALAVPGQEALYPAGTPAVVSGWGSTGNALEGAPTVLQHASIPIVSDADCATAYGTDVDAARNLCAGDPVDGLPTPCYGDSGGPLVVDDGGSPLQVGIVLGGDGCPAPQRPAIFSRVAANQAFVGRYLDPNEVPDRPRRVRTSQQGSTLRVSWRPPHFDGGAKITGYAVEVSGGGASVGVGGGGRARHVDIELADGPLQVGGRYTVKVRATNAVGTGAARVGSVTIHTYPIP